MCMLTLLFWLCDEVSLMCLYYEKKLKQMTQYEMLWIAKKYLITQVSVINCDLSKPNIEYPN